MQNNAQTASSSTLFPHAQNEASAFVAKNEDTVMSDATIPPAPAPPTPKPVFFTKYTSTTDIPYAPEDALKEGLGMVKSIKTSIKTIQLGSKLRQDVWLRELERWSCLLHLLYLCLNTLSFSVSRAKVLRRH